MAGSTAELLVLVKARDQASRALGRISGAAGGMGKAVRRGALIGGVALAGAGIAAVKFAADFEAAMSESIAIMGDVSDALRNDMEKAAREVALTTTFSAKEAAEAYFFLASAGLDAAASVKALPQVAQFAQAGMFDMALATDLLTDAQSSLGLSSKDVTENMKQMARVSDVLVKAGTLANATVQQFSESLTNKAGVALQKSNQQIETGVAVLAAFAGQGIKGAEAGTQLGIVLRDLKSKGIDNASAFAEMNIEVFDQQGNMNNLIDIVADMEGALDGMSTAQQVAALKQLGFADKSIQSIQAILGLSDAMGEYERQLLDAAGITEEVAAKQLVNFNAQLSLLKSAFQDVFITVGQLVLPHLTKLAALLRTDVMPAVKTLANVFKLALTGQLNKLFATMRDDVDPELRVFADAVIKVAEFVRDDLMPAFQSIWGFMQGNLLPMFMDGVAVLRDHFLPVLQDVGQWFSDNKPALIVAITAIGIAILIALGPGAIAVAAILGFIVLLGFMKEHFQGLVGPAQKASGVLAKVIGFLGGTQKVLLAVAIAVGALLVPAFVAWAVSAAVAAAATLLALLPIILVIAAIALLVLGIIWLVQNWETVTAFLVDAWNAALDFVAEKATWLWGQVVKIFEAVWAFLKKWGPLIAAIILTTFLGPLPLIIFAIIKFRREILAFFLSIKDKIVDIVVATKDGVVGAFQAIPGLLLGLVDRFLGAGKALGAAIKNGILEGLQAVGGFIASLATQVFNAIKEVINIGIQTINTLIPDSLTFKKFGIGVTINLPDNPIPSLAHGAFATAPTLALIGDAPGGEAVLNVPQIKALIRSGGGGGGPTVVINGGLMGDAIDAQRIARVTERAMDRARRR